jgi:hypothetical protein
MHQIRESLAVGHRVFIASPVLENPSIRWAHALLAKPGTFVVHEADEIAGAIPRITGRRCSASLH